MVFFRYGIAATLVLFENAANAKFVRLRADCLLLILEYVVGQIVVDVAEFLVGLAAAKLLAHRYAA